MPPPAKLDPVWRKARIAARIFVKKQFGGEMSRCDRALARLLSNDDTITNDAIRDVFGEVEVEFIARRWANGRHVHPEPAWLRQR